MGLKLSFVIEAVDKVTANSRAITASVNKMTAPVRRLQASVGSLAKAAREGGGLNVLTEKGAALQQRFQGVGNELRGIRNAMTMVAGIGGGAFYGLKRLADAGDEAVDTAEKMGMTVPEWQRLAHAADIAKMPHDALADSLKFLGRNAVDAALGSEQSAIWFRRANIQVTDSNGKIKTNAQLFRELSDSIAKMPDGNKKLSLSMALLNRSGDDMIEILNGGSKGLDEMAREAEALGKVNEDAARKGDDFGKGYVRLLSVLQGVANTIGQFLLPMVTDLMAQLKEWIGANRELIGTKIKEFIAEFVKQLPAIIEGVKFLFQTLYVLARAVNWIAQVFGGWGSVLKFLAVFIAAKLVFSILLMTKAVLGFGWALLTTPVGWFLLAVAAIAGAVYLVYKNWGPLKEWFGSFWDDIKGAFSGNIMSIENLIKRFIRVTLFPLIKTLEIVQKLMPDSMKKTAVGRNIGNALAWVNGQPPSAEPSPIVAGGGAAKLNGNIKIEVEDKRIRTREVQSSNSGVDINVHTGHSMASS